MFGQSSGIHSEECFASLLVQFYRLQVFKMIPTCFGKLILENILLSYKSNKPFKKTELCGCGTKTFCDLLIWYLAGGGFFFFFI